MAWKKLYIQPNKAAQKAAKRGLEARRKAPKSKKGGLDAVQASMAGVGSGVLRARDIVAGKRVNAYQVNAFFNRHRNNYVNASIEGLKPVESRAIQAWLLWGGEPLRKQAAAAVRKDKAKRNPAENTSRDPARMSDEDLQAELDSAVGRVGEAVHQTEWEQEPEYVLGYEPSGRVIYKSSPGERFPKTLEGPPHDYTPEQYRERLRRYYDIFQEIRSRPHLSVVGIWWDETSHFLQGKSGGDEDLIEFVNGWKNDQILEHEFSRDRENEELKIRQEAQAIIENRSSKQEEYRKHLWGQVRALPGIREDAFGNPIARSVARRNRRAKRNPIDTRDPTDDEIEDQAAAISRLLGETARNSEDHPHEVDLPQTRRAWKMYKSLEKEKESRIAKRNRKAKRNPDHIIDLDERRRKAEVERIFGSPEDPDFFEGLDFEDLDPVEESTSAIMDSVDDYCRVRGNPRRYNPSIERGGKISYGEYYGLPDGDGGYDLYYKDAIIASGVDTVEQAEEEISQHLESL